MYLSPATTGGTTTRSGAKDSKRLAPMGAYSCRHLTFPVLASTATTRPRWVGQRISSPASTRWMAWMRRWGSETIAVGLATNSLCQATLELAATVGDPLFAFQMSLHRSQRKQVS